MRLTRATVAVSALSLALVGSLFVRAATPAASTPSNAERVKRGEYLVTIAACHDCHSPKVDAQMNLDVTRLLSGRPATTMPPMQGSGEVRASLDLTRLGGSWEIATRRTSRGPGNRSGRAANEEAFQDDSHGEEAEASRCCRRCRGQSTPR
jgi:hypothetical protein